MRVGLEAKAVVGLLAIAIAPLVVSVVLVRQVALVAQSVAVGEAERLYAALERAKDAYIEAIDLRKRSYRHQAEEVAGRPSLRDACNHGAEPAELQPLLEDELGHDRSLTSLSLTLAGKGLRAEASRERDPSVHRLTLTAAYPLAEAPLCIVSLTFATGKAAKLAEDYEALGLAMQEHRQLEKIRRSLPPSYLKAFAISMGAFALVIATLAIVFARRITRRLDRLVDATRRVAEGDLSTRLQPRGQDELADLARAFDDMVDDLVRSRAEIEYLHKIGAWQEVARRLAHEIKNPLTPIQLAMQELIRQYRGDDPRFQKLLADVGEIVGEEIGGLRRLVDAFSGLAKLPRVEPRPLDLAVVVDDVTRDLPDTLAVDTVAPPAPVTIAGDRLLLRRALVNLLDNAREAGARRARIVWRRDGETARVTISDDGPGVPAEKADKIFDPYMTTKVQGSGLGLAIVKKTILEHGGSIVLSPQPAAELGGASFDITLPCGAS